MTRIRCAIYTRKSSEEGLEQDFNSLDAQREACSAYILSQGSEGWNLIPRYYDDGGLSGGTLERPALKRLLEDVKAGHIDIIVVYKVDRLTRSLLDFAKLVECFDEANVSFVSVTQSFNTTTSMGRLTLNMLLSFAQFEREVTAERIRDKIAASKAKGMWMGGIPPLGYAPNGRSLAIVEEHAEIIRDIYRRYLGLGNVRLVSEELVQEGIVKPIRTTNKGHAYGGRPFTRGQLYAILRNPIYAGDIAHKGEIYPGNHDAIIARDTWNAVQHLLASHVQGKRQTTRSTTSLLAGLIVDAEGEPLLATHACKKAGGKVDKGTVRYRYYVSKALQQGTGRDATSSLRIPAREIEQVVMQEVAGLFGDAMGLAARIGIALKPDQLPQVSQRCADIATGLKKRSGRPLRKLLSQVRVLDDRLEIELSSEAIGEILRVSSPDVASSTFCLAVDVRLTRTGRAVRLVQDNGFQATGNDGCEAIARLVVRARQWWALLADGQTTITEVARQEGVTPSYVTRVVRLAFLAPDVVDAILDGNIRADVDARALLATDAISPDWEEQAMRLLHANRPLASSGTPQVERI